MKKQFLQDQTNRRRKTHTHLQRGANQYTGNLDLGINSIKNENSQAVTTKTDPATGCVPD